jgi:hypothetical protein
MTVAFGVEVTDDVQPIEDLGLEIDVSKIQVRNSRGVVAGVVKTYETQLVEQITQ